MIIHPRHFSAILRDSLVTHPVTYRDHHNKMVVIEGKIALLTFLLYVFLVLYVFFEENIVHLQWMVSCKFPLALSLTLIGVFLPYSQVTRRAALLGCLFGVGILLNMNSTYDSWSCLGWYLCSLSFFHFSEYIMTALYNENKLSIDSFLLNHSFEYKMAAVASWLEFFIEYYTFPFLKSQFTISFLGLCLVVFGELLRKIAMVTAKTNFTHLIQYKKRDQHILVTWGVYGLCRHPGYVGWFFWSIGKFISVFLEYLLSMSSGFKILFIPRVLTM